MAERLWEMGRKVGSSSWIWTLGRRVHDHIRQTLKPYYGYEVLTCNADFLDKISTDVIMIQDEQPLQAGDVQTVDSTTDSSIPHWDWRTPKRS